MAKRNLGTKHTCASCGTKFYDLGRPDPSCPRCGWTPGDAGEVAPGAGVSPSADDDGGILNLRTVFETGAEIQGELDEELPDEELEGDDLETEEYADIDDEVDDADDEY